MKTIDIAEVIKDMNSGYTRLKKKGITGKSIQEKYGLSVAEVNALFKLPELEHLNARRVGIGISFAVVNGASTNNSETLKAQQEVNDIVDENVK